MNSNSDFSDAVLSFGVTGAGVSIDPATGALSLRADALDDGIEVTVTTVGAGDAAPRRFRLTIAAVAGDGVAPVLVVAPALPGEARIGMAVAVDPGIWNGDPVPALTFQWRRNGADIAGATGATYVPGPEEDCAALSCRIVAGNVAGQAAAETAALTVAWPAPVAAGVLPDLRLTQGGGTRTVEVAGAFSGGGLVFAAAGAGASADPATGRVTVPADVLVADAVVTVSAANSGGAAAVEFRVGVAPAVLPPVAGAIADVAWTPGSGPQTVSAQAAFTGGGLSFTLDEAPAGVTIDPGSGLITVPTVAELADATVTVRAANAAGVATCSFAVTVQAAPTTNFDVAAALAELGFLHTGAAPSFTPGDSFARLVPAAGSRVHGVWSRAAGDGLYRALVRWGAGGASFVFGARVRLEGADFAGVYLDVFQPLGGAGQLRLLEYVGSGAIAIPLRQVPSGWSRDTWHWVELVITGAAVKARLYPEADVAPGWQIEARTAATGPGAFGPGAGGSPAIDIRRLEYLPPEATAPNAAQDGDWTLMQITEQS